MTTLALQTIAGEIDGQLSHGDCQFDRICTDTRTLQPGDVFVALRGPRFDAHDFLDEAVRKHASALIVEKCDDSIQLPQLVVKDTTWALGQIARINREQFRGPVIGITGSCGKTTVKTLVHNILALCGNVLATRGSLNNHIGVPLTLFELNREHEFAVIEMGASAPGEIAYLAQLVKPDVALVTNALLAHVAGFGSLRGVAEAKGEIYQSLKPDAVAIVNADDPQINIWLDQTGKRNTVHFSIQGKSAEFTASEIDERVDGTVAFALSMPDARFPVHLQLLGKQNVANALAAAACAYSVGATAEHIRQGLEQSCAVSGRMQAHSGINNSIVIDDSYNANPDSVKAAVDSLVRWQGKTVLVLGDLGELGQDEQQLHEQLGSYARSAGVSCLLATGTLTPLACAAFGNGAEHFEDHAGIVSRLQELLDADTVVLVKGSRAARMEQVVNAIVVD